MTDQRKGYERSPDYGGRNVGRGWVVAAVLVPAVTIGLVAAAIILWVLG